MGATVRSGTAFHVANVTDERKFVAFAVDEIEKPPLNIVRLKTEFTETGFGAL